LQLNSAFGPGNGGFVKAENGLLILNADNGAWTGAVTVSAGTLRVTNAGALGSNLTSANATVSGSGAALEVAGLTLSESLSLTGSGVSSGGALRSISGTTTISAA